jgi:DNA helicase-4
MILKLIIVSIVIFIIALVYYKKTVNNKYNNSVYINNLDQVSLFLETLNQIEDYITWVYRDEIKNQFLPVGKFFKNKSKFYEKEEKVRSFNELFQDFDNYVVKYNKNYIQTQKEKLSDYFENIEGKKLDDQQITALITDEYSNLIIAGAGSGKTLTILGKVKYLIEKKNINPENILLLSFTKKTVSELNLRLQNISLDVKATTFHKLGYDTIKNNQIGTPVLTNDNTLNKLVKEYFEKDIFNDTVALEAYIRYVACYMNIPEEENSYDSLGEKLDVEKGIDFQTLKSKCEPETLNKVAFNSLDSIQGEKVKSVEELSIANFLYLNGIEYEYEKVYPYTDFIYRPDFYLTDYDLYIEHFGVDENNRAKWLSDFNEQKYIEEMQMKRESHKKYNTKLLETYSYYNRNNILLEKLEEILKNENVVFKPRDLKGLHSKVIANDKNFGTGIANLIETFINLYKSKQLNYDSLSLLFLDNKNARNKFMHERQEIFLKFAIPILLKYDNTLKEFNEIDFNDMINQATDLIKEKKPQYTYQYIIIDEYQDISYSRFNLIKAIRELSQARLICVGDDWQSIYRFAGSDISLFSNFEKHVGKHEKLFIEKTYRNSQSLINISAQFIQKNSKQIQKSPVSTKEDLNYPISFVSYSNQNAEEILINEIRALIEKYGNKSILVLGRHSFDINEFIRLSPNSKVKYYERTDKLEIKKLENIDIKYTTVHKSKGLEADNVILLNLKNHLLGFPNKVTDDPMLSLLLSDDEEYLFAEERRLFYVALTRTKNEAIFLVPKDVSMFAEEIIKDNPFSTSIKNENPSITNCPYCQTGHLVIRNNANNKNQFLGCTNYPICNQTFNNILILENTILCDKCKSGFLTTKIGKYSNFLGCSNYPKCSNTIK